MGPTKFGPDWSELVWSDLVWSDWIWSDLVWSDLVGSDLVWSDLVRSTTTMSGAILPQPITVALLGLQPELGETNYTLGRTSVHPLDSA